MWLAGRHGTERWQPCHPAITNGDTPAPILQAPPARQLTHCVFLAYKTLASTAPSCRVWLDGARAVSGADHGWVAGWVGALSVWPVVRQALPTTVYAERCRHGLLMQSRNTSLCLSLPCSERCTTLRQRRGCSRTLEGAHALRRYLRGGGPFEHSGIGILVAAAQRLLCRLWNPIAAGACMCSTRWPCSHLRTLQAGITLHRKHELPSGVYTTGTQQTQAGCVLSMSVHSLAGRCCCWLVQSLTAAWVVPESILGNKQASGEPAVFRQGW